MNAGGMRRSIDEAIEIATDLAWREADALVVRMRESTE
jgi:hypothetical protein